MQKKISFILPIYGTDLTLFESCLERLASLADLAYEFLLVSDGAAVDLVAICQRFVIQDERFRLIEQENQGVSVARNTGITNAKGTWIAFVDPDDLVSANFETSVKPFLSSEADIIFGGFTRFYGDGINEATFRRAELFPQSDHLKNDDLIRATLSDGNYYHEIYGYYLGTPWAKLFRRTFILNNHLAYPVGIIKREDALFSIEAFLKDPNVCVIDDIIYHYRIDHVNSISNNYSTKVKASFYQLFEKLSFDLQNWVQANPENRQIFATYCLRLSIELLFVDFCNPNNQATYQTRKAAFTIYLEHPVIDSLIKSANLTNMPIKQKIIGFLIKQKQFKLLDCLLNRKKG